MSDIRQSLRELFLRSVKMVNSAASSLADSTRSKVDELNLRNRRKELVEEVVAKAVDLWKNGQTLPDGLTALLEELQHIDDELATRAAYEKESAEAPAGEATGAAGAESVEMPENSAAEPVETSGWQTVPTMFPDAPVTEQPQPFTVPSEDDAPHIVVDETPFEESTNTPPEDRP